MDGIVQDQGARSNHVLGRERLHGYTADGVSWMEESTWDTHIWKYRYDGRRDRDEECGMQDCDLDTFQLLKRADRRYSDTVDTQTSTSDTPRSFRPSRPFPCEYVVGLCFWNTSIRIVEPTDRPMVNHLHRHVQVTHRCSGQSQPIHICSLPTNHIKKKTSTKPRRV
jgi:hypothetical protein